MGKPHYCVHNFPFPFQSDSICRPFEMQWFWISWVKLNNTQKTRFFSNSNCKISGQFILRVFWWWDGSLPNEPVLTLALQKPSDLSRTSYGLRVPRACSWSLYGYINPNIWDEGRLDWRYGISILLDKVQDPKRKHSHISQRKIFQTFPMHHSEVKRSKTSLK